MSKKLVNWCTCTVSSHAPKYTFVIELNDWAMYALRYENVLCFKYEKNKYVFLEQLAEALSQEIAEHLERLDEKK